MLASHHEPAFEANAFGNKSYVLVTGGTGYIGSHTVLELLTAGYNVIVVDNLSNSSEESLRRVQKITGRNVTFHKADIVDYEAMDYIFSHYNISAVLHFAGLKAVGESAQIPLTYYQKNITGSLVLFELMEKYGVYNIVFSSSATVYGHPDILPVKESATMRPTNPYGRTKYYVEEILRDMCKADKKWNAILLRYFNPTGAHLSGLIGEDPRGIPNNLMPYVAQVVVGKRTHVNVFGGDYDTSDGTGVRDYIHVVDVARGHLSALKKLQSNPGCVAYNLGTGRGYSVLEIISAMTKAAGKKIPYEIVERRPGDVGTVTADSSLAREELQWEAKYGLDAMCVDLWRWQSQNPTGYQSL
ncbi:UDP-glucose 4-epimerase [Basidiobolus meristosporus CBS 931.73]|uniref:UDP-glucose 4-epimerase n=1 Tax=Basidiobolus meristosporus CBS 931.73 TaxID=1314790 RepID=A0A1Y1VRB4_9FUNG|nr:UDP-glucose 4-epimerase [Basidiobolus meristosporus CBS 931.73]ORY04322.1 UDP-glucose 4-epimerase [Basidiobolus meristosporus CBS 931.73]|eukprot:ORX63828.1 UDP-glucose 4-epimerase [Basidiobolus meristosporus CBS 931.73]